MTHTAHPARNSVLHRVTPRSRPVLVAVIGAALLAPSQIHPAHAAMTITPGYVKNTSKVTLSMSGINSVHSTADPAGQKKLQISGPTEGASTSYTPTNIRFSGGALLADVDFATGTLGAGPGTYTVKLCEVSCTGSLPIEDAGTFTVTAPWVRIDTPAVPQLVSRAATSTVAFTGLFARGVAASVNNPSITAGTPTTVDGTHVTIPITTSAGTPPGRYDLTVRNTDGTTDSCHLCLRVSDFALTATNPTNMPNDPGRQPIEVTGTDLPTGAQLVGTLLREPQIPGQGPITSLGTQPQSPGNWKGFFNLADAAPGSYRLRLTAEDDSTVGLCTCLLTIRVSDLPTISSITPAAVGQGAHDYTVIAHGANFPHGAVLSVPSSSKVTLGETQWVDNKTLAVKVLVDPTAPIGKVDVTETNPVLPGTAVCAQCLAVNPHPSISSLAPDTLTQGDQHKTLTLTGDQLNADTQLAFNKGVTLESAKFVDSKTFQLVVSVDNDAAGGLHAITATNPDGSTSGAVTALAVRRVIQAAIAQSATAVSYGQTVLLFGRITYADTGAPAAEQTATLMAATGGAYSSLVDVTTDKDGNWKYHATPARNTTYRLDVTAVGAAPASSEVLKVLVTPRIAITSPRGGTSTSSTKPLTVIGTVAPAAAGPVTVFARDGQGRIKASQRVTPTSTGRFTATLKLPRGTYRLYASTAGSSAYAGAVSPSLSIRRT